MGTSGPRTAFSCVHLEARRYLIEECTSPPIASHTLRCTSEKEDEFPRMSLQEAYMLFVCCSCKPGTSESPRARIIVCHRVYPFVCLSAAELHALWRLLIPLLDRITQARFSKISWRLTSQEGKSANSQLQHPCGATASMLMLQTIGCDVSLPWKDEPDSLLANGTDSAPICKKPCLTRKSKDNTPEDKDGKHSALNAKPTA